MRATGTKSVAGDALHTALGSGRGGESSPSAALIAALLADSALKRVAEVQVGEYAGTGADVVVALDFDPIAVIIYNLTDGTMLAVAANTASAAGANGKAAKIVAAAGPVATAAGGIVWGTRQFTAHDAALVTNLKTFQFIAIGA